MKITNISIRTVKMDEVEALATITLDDEFVIHDMMIINDGDGYSLVMRSRNPPKGNHKDLVHPITSKYREMLKKAILAKYNSI